MSIWLTAFSVLSVLFYFIATISCFMIYGVGGLLILLGLPLFMMSTLWLDRWNELQSQISLGNEEVDAIADIKELFKSLNLNL